MASGLVLLVEDNTNLRKLYATYLETQGYTVLSFGSADAALQYTSSGVPKLIILDIMLPGIDGIEACRRMRQSFGSRVPILFITAIDDAHTLEEAFAAGGNDYIIKSRSMKPLRDRMEYWSRAESRYLMDIRQSHALSEIQTYVRTNPKKGKTADAPGDETARKREQKTEKETCPPPDEGLSRDGETTVRLMSQLVRRAYIDSGGPGDASMDKTYLFGYTGGVVDYFASGRPEITSRFHDYLRAVLADVDILSVRDIDDMMAHWDTFCGDPHFRKAFDHGRNACRTYGAPSAALAVEERKKARTAS